MLIFLADGRLGNQLFQYSFLKSIQKDKELLLISGFEELDKYFEHDYFCNINKQNRYLRYVVYEIIQKVLIFMGYIHLISVVSVVMEKIDGLSRESTKYITHYGLFRGIKFVKLGYFQSEKFINKRCISSLKLKPEYVSSATKFMQSLPQNVYPVFVHVHKGDYRYHTISGKSTDVPNAYYLQAISWFTKHKKNPFFVFVSDEPDTLGVDFKDIKNKVISYGNNSGTDLAIMSKCRGAVMSPSIFSWWGSYLMGNRDVVIAPKYWLGFNWGVEYQAGGTPSYAKVIKI